MRPMPAFERRLSEQQIGGLLLEIAEHPDGLIADLFRLWRPSGAQISPEERGLRIGVRRDYLNLYRQGQSVARVTFDRRFAPRIEIHRKYLGLRHRQPGRAEAPDGEQPYAVLRGCDLSTGYAGREALAGWIDAAASYAGREKRFVDTLVGLNGTVIDLEMALPADTTYGHAAERAAPRMDLVLVQHGSSGPQVAFWEAKCVDNPELRAARFDDPWNGAKVGRAKIFSQLQRYRAWMDAGRRIEVLAAYQATLTSLAGLRDGLVNKADINVPELAPSIRASAERPLGMMETLGVVIAADDEFGGTTKLASFEAEKPYAHRKRLERAGYHVEIVGEGRESGVLPRLT